MPNHPDPVKKPAGGTVPQKPPSERKVDEALDESFPASDPPAYGGSTGAGAPDDAKSTKTRAKSTETRRRA